MSKAERIEAKKRDLKLVLALLVATDNTTAPTEPKARKVLLRRRDNLVWGLNKMGAFA